MVGREARRLTARFLTGDCLGVLRGLPDESVACCVTSPPYWGLRDYGSDSQIGLEPTPEAYVSALVAVFREVRRALRRDGTLWLNLGDSWAAGRGGTAMPAETLAGGIGGHGDSNAHRGRLAQVPNTKNPNAPIATYQPHRNAGAIGLKHKDMIGIPWRVAFALQADGWYLRSDIIWAKPNPMPESVVDRPTKSHEHVFLLSKSGRYHYDPAAGKEATVDGSGERNMRDVWSIRTRPYREAHFAVMPVGLAERCVLIGCPRGGTVLDPFGGAGTTAYAAEKNGRDSVSIELNGDYVEMAERRLAALVPDASQPSLPFAEQIGA